MDAPEHLEPVCSLGEATAYSLYWTFDSEEAVYGGGQCEFVFSLELAGPDSARAHLRLTLTQPAS